MIQLKYLRKGMSNIDKLMRQYLKFYQKIILKYKIATLIS